MELVGCFLVPLIFIVALVLIALPVKLAAAAMGAERTGFGWSLLALLVASILHTIGLSIPLIGTVVAFLLSAAGFAAILRTNFLRGIGIAVLHLVFSFLLVMVLLLFGLSIPFVASF